MNSFYVLVIILQAASLCCSLDDEIEKTFNREAREHDHRWEWIPDKSGEMHLIDLNDHPQPFFVAFLDIKFFLYTRSETRREIDLFRPLGETSFNKSDLTVFMIHGWQDDGARFPLVIDAYLSHEPSNCIMVDWSGGSKTIDYISASNRVYEVGEYVAWFIDNEYQKGAMTSNVHIVGHSLGAHAAGAVGKKLNSFRIEKIFGLDPAGPLFENTSEDKRLHRNDAEHVIILHTTTRLGMLKPIGHFDFYINYGRDQPGCGLNAMAICGHSRVMDYFAESVNTDGFVGVLCSPLHYSDLVKNKECVYPSQETVIMTPFGQKYDDYSRISLIKTFAASPFAMNFAPQIPDTEYRVSRFTRYKQNILCWFGYYSAEQCVIASE